MLRPATAVCHLGEPAPLPTPTAARPAAMEEHQEPQGGPPAEPVLAPAAVQTEEEAPAAPDAPAGAPGRRQRRLGAPAAERRWRPHPARQLFPAPPPAPGRGPGGPMARLAPQRAAVHAAAGARPTPPPPPPDPAAEATHDAAPAEEEVKPEDPAEPVQEMVRLRFLGAGQESATEEGWPAGAGTRTPTDRRPHDPGLHVEPCSGARALRHPPHRAESATHHILHRHFHLAGRARR